MFILFIFLSSLLFISFLSVSGVTVSNLLIKKNNLIYTKLNFINSIVFGLFLYSFLYLVLGYLGKLDLYIFIVLLFFLVHFFKLRFLCVFYKYNYSKFKAFVSSNKKLLLILSPFLFFGIGFSFTPEQNWDSISYILYMPKVFNNNNEITYLANYGIFSAFPSYQYAILGFIYIFENVSLVKLVLFLIFVLLSLQNLIGITKLFNINRSISILCIPFFFYIPIILENISIVKVDLLLCAFYFQFLYFLFSYIKTKNNFYLIIVFFIAAFSFGIKYTVIFYFPLFFLIIFYDNTFILKKYKLLLGLILLSLAINIPWIFYNYLFHCNPFFPLFNNFFNACSYDQESIKNIMTMIDETTLFNIGTSWHVNENISDFFQISISKFSLFFTILILAFPVRFFLNNKNINSSLDSKYFYWSLYFFSILVLVFILFIYYWEYRYFLFLFSNVFIIFLFFISSINKQKFKYFFIFLLFLQSSFSLHKYYLSKIPEINLLLGKYSQEFYMDNFIHLYWVAKFLNINTLSDDTIAFNWGVQPFFYTNRNLIFIHDWNPEFSLLNIVSEKDLLYYFKANKINYLVWRNQDDSRFIKKNSLSKNFHKSYNEYKNRLIESKNIKLIYTKDDVLIFEISY